ncbi:hypothetical protein H9P43_007684 [Blastocladiella emersonii ATCC 22665]|nr:hypothetical protein H9P43_007684 [Blastocladiella emersonii ATCC 22665]
MNAIAFLAALVLALVATAAATPATAKGPFPVPVTYKVSSTHTATFGADGKLVVKSDICCSRVPCVEAGGSGDWSYDAKADALTVSFWMSPQWTLSQTWTCAIKSKDVKISRLEGCKTVSFSGAKGNTAPLPPDAKTWVRI